MSLYREANLLQASRCRVLQYAPWPLLLLGLSASAAAPAAPPPASALAPERIDLDRFDALKRTVALPNGVTLAYVPLGDPSGPPVVLIHGYTDSARDWVPLVPYLAPHLRLILVDIRGHGRSSRPECCYTRLDFAYDIKLLLDALAIQRADIVGHSMGSYIAQTFAEEWPQRTHRVVLISSSGGPPPGAPPPKVDRDYAAQIRQLKEPIAPDSPFMISWWSSPTLVDEDFLSRQRRDSAAMPLYVWLGSLDLALAPADLQQTLPRLQAPTLLIWGSKDPIMPEEVRATLRAALPHATVKVFPGLGHNPFWEDPRGCAEVINRFLTAAPAGPARPG